MPKNKNTVYRRNKPPVTRRKWPLIVVTVVVIASAALSGYKLWSKDSSTPKVEKTHSTANSETKGEPKEPATDTSDSEDSQSSTPPADSGSQKPVQEGPSGQTELITPSGNFVSNHHPSLNNSPSLQSVCVTTPGATCHITFTKDGVVKALSTETADRGGAVYWTWKLQDIGITAGSWRVTAEATWGSQTKSASDTLSLEVAP